MTSQTQTLKRRLAIARGQLEQLQRLADLESKAAAVKARTERAEHQRYAKCPSLFIRDHVELPPGRIFAPYQLDALDELAEHSRLALRGPRGMGKTTIAAFAVHWFARTREALGLDWKILTTAGVYRHLYRALWPEVHKWAPRFSGLYAPLREDKELLTASIHMRHGQAFGAVAKHPDMIESAHADELLILIDEAKSVPESIWDALEGSLTGESGQYVLALSTPGAPAGRFYQIHQGRLDGWKARHVTPAEAVAAGRVSASSIERRGKYWGTDSALYRQQVLGDFAADDEHAVIPLSWVEAAMERWETWRDELGRPELDGAPSYGVDVATTGADKSVIARRVGIHTVELAYTSGNSVMGVVGKAQGFIRKAHRASALVVVDNIGVGSGVASRLDELGYRVMRYTGSAATSRRTTDREFGFNNTRTAAYWHLRELLDPETGAGIMLPPHEQLTADLTTPKLLEPLTGSPPKLRMERKEDLVARLGRSPDFGDAVVMAYWADVAHTEVETAKPGKSGRLPRRGLSSLDKG
jgi:hypothetical protein